MTSDAFATRAIHAGQEPDPRTGAIAVPLYQTSTFAMDAVGVMRAGYDYSRAGNPTTAALETSLADLENGRHATAFASGMAAVDVALRATLSSGDHVIVPADGYGGTFRLLDDYAASWGLRYTPVALDDLAAVRAAVTPTTKLIWCETPTNPLLSIADIAALAEIAHDNDALLVVDNTFASPYLQTPLDLGADVVMHSTTKYLGGHSDVLGGALITRDETLAERIGSITMTAGLMASPFESWLTLRGIKTLPLRMERHCDNAERVARMLADSPAVEQVYYPGLEDHPGHAVAAGQMRRYGGMVSFAVAGGRDAAVAVCERTRLFTLAESLGGVESLIEHPALMTHVSVEDTDVAVADNLIRLSVGVEDGDDLLADLAHALG